MKIKMLSFGGKHEAMYATAIEHFTKRLNFYYPAEWVLPPAPKNAAALPPSQLKLEEGNWLLKHLENNFKLILLDETGKMQSSLDVAKHLEQFTQANTHLLFVIGGAYGVSNAVKNRADLIWKLSDLVFPHQLVRLILAEQLYRACTIIRNEKYHHI